MTTMQVQLRPSRPNNVRLETRIATDTSQFQAPAKEIVGSRPDVIPGGGTAYFQHFETGAKPQLEVGRKLGLRGSSTAGTSAAPSGHVDHVLDPVLAGKDTAAGVRRFREMTAADGTFIVVVSMFHMA